MASMFQGTAAAGSDDEGAPSLSGKFGTLRREGATATPGFGTMGFKSRVPRDYDPVLAARKMPRVHVTSNAIMEPAAFAGVIRSICHAIGLMAEGNEARREAVHHGVVKYFSLNGSSVQAPGRAELLLEGAAGPVPAAAYIIKYFGDSLRRGARCVADEILQQRRDLYDRRAFLSDDELFEVDLMDVQAASAGLDRYPWLAFDVADFCTSRVISFSERALVRQAKAALLGNTPNTADRMVVAAAEQVAAAGGGLSGGNKYSGPASSSGFAY